jgi:GTP cyclohydrolase I
LQSKSVMYQENDWQTLVRAGLHKFLHEPAVIACLSDDHLKNTPDRFVKALIELTAGVAYDASQDLTAHFDEDVYDEMILIGNIPFSSLCCHHLLPFSGYAWFGYIPDKSIVGLSKVPRVIDGFSARPQVQERLTSQIAEEFYKIVAPLGCGLVMEAEHSCMALRGVKKHESKTLTSHLCGSFKTNHSTKQEFLDYVNSSRRR